MNSFQSSHPVIEKKVTPRCQHFGECGGCLFQDVPYEEQVAVKEKKLQELYNRTVSIVPSPSSYQYRTRMDFVTAFGKIGLRPRCDYRRVVNINRCELLSDRSNKILEQVRALIKEFDIQDYDYLSHRGFLRYLIIRETMKEENMVIFVTCSPDDELHSRFESFIDKLLCFNGNSIQSLYWLVQDRKSDVSYGEPLLYCGSPYIVEEIEDYRFQIGPNTFFQGNTRIAAQCFLEIRRHTSGKRILDLYSGIGVIDVLLASCDREIVGVELSSESVNLAKQNADLNEIQNASFICSDVRSYLRNDESLWDTIVLDPPRSGAGRRIMKKISEKKPDRILYMSCNPRTHWDDVQFLDEYNLTYIKAFDIFPQTPHVEVVSVLERK